MAKYDFDQLIPRRGTNSVKWDEEPAADILPMWVAEAGKRLMSDAEGEKLAGVSEGATKTAASSPTAT